MSEQETFEEDYKPGMPVRYTMNTREWIVGDHRYRAGSWENMNTGENGPCVFMWNQYREAEDPPSWSVFEMWPSTEVARHVLARWAAIDMTKAQQLQQSVAMWIDVSDVFRGEER